MRIIASIEALLSTRVIMPLFAALDAGLEKHVLAASASGNGLEAAATSRLDPPLAKLLATFKQRLEAAKALLITKLAPLVRKAAAALAEQTRSGAEQSRPRLDASRKGLLATEGLIRILRTTLEAQVSEAIFSALAAPLRRVGGSVRSMARRLDAVETRLCELGAAMCEWKGGSKPQFLHCAQPEKQ